MQFNSLVFAAFFAIVLLLNNLPVGWRVKKFNLLWLSYLFYAAWNPPFVALLWVSTLADWFIAKRMHNTEHAVHRRLLLILSLCVNLGMLCYFKYGAFAVENFQALLFAMGVEWQPAVPSIVLPIGISFYTFQTLSYTLDIHARRIKPWDSFLDYALFVTFFPQLVAGPIVRARQFLPQCAKEIRATARDLAWGMSCIVIGLFQKVVIADGLLAGNVEAVFDVDTAPTFVDGWIGSMGFACQIFCDFAGYSICAIGVARCLGFWLPMNFNYPLASPGFGDFWRRWHISLATWLRDYVYRPMGGNRVSMARWMFNVMFTWTLIGLWHGSAWNFVLWGTSSGLLIVLERVVRETGPSSEAWSHPVSQFGFGCLQFVGFSITLLMWRAPDFSRLGEVANTMFLGTPDGRPMILSMASIMVTATTVSVLFLWHWYMRSSSLEELADRSPRWLKSAALTIMLLSIVLIPGRDHAFIYFQF